MHEIVRLGRTVLIAESELQHVPDYAKRIYVMERGEIVFSGSLDEARRDPTCAASSAQRYSEAGSSSAMPAATFRQPWRRLRPVPSRAARGPVR